MFNLWTHNTDKYILQNDYYIIKPAVMKSESTYTALHKNLTVSQTCRTNERIVLTRSKQVAQLSERDGAAGWISFFAKSRRRYSADIICLSSATVT